MPLFHFAVTRGGRYLFQCIPGYKNFSVILFIWRSFSEVLGHCIEVNISLLITIFKGAGNYCLPSLNTRHICWWTWIFFFTSSWMLGLLLYALFFKVTHMLKSHGFGSDERGGHNSQPFIQSSKDSLNCRIVSVVTWCTVLLRKGIVTRNGTSIQRMAPECDIGVN